MLPSPLQGVSAAQDFKNGASFPYQFLFGKSSGQLNLNFCFHFPYASADFKGFQLDGLHGGISPFGSFEDGIPHRMDKLSLFKTSSPLKT